MFPIFVPCGREPEGIIWLDIGNIPHYFIIYYYYQSK